MMKKTTNNAIHIIWLLVAVVWAIKLIKDWPVETHGIKVYVLGLILISFGVCDFVGFILEKSGMKANKMRKCRGITFVLVCAAFIASISYVLVNSPDRYIEHMNEKWQIYLPDGFRIVEKMDTKDENTDIKYKVLEYKNKPFFDETLDFGETTFDEKKFSSLLENSGIDTAMPSVSDANACYMRNGTDELWVFYDESKRQLYTVEMISGGDNPGV